MTIGAQSYSTFIDFSKVRKNQGGLQRGHQYLIKGGGANFSYIFVSLRAWWKHAPC